MIKWANPLFCDKSVEKRKKQTIWAVKSGRIQYSLYCVTLSTNPENLFDIIHVNELKFPYYQKQEIYALGLAKGKDNAISLVMDMISEVYQNTGDVKVREYFQDRWDLC